MKTNINVFIKNMSWIDEEEELLQIQDDCDTEHMEEIECVFIFVNVNSYI